MLFYICLIFVLFPVCFFLGYYFEIPSIGAIRINTQVRHAGPQTESTGPQCLTCPLGAVV